MHKLEHLLGVTHGASQVGYNGQERPLLIEPPAELLDILRGLPRGSTVALEFTPEIRRPLRFQGQLYPFDPSNLYYWRQLERSCTALGLRVMHIDSYALLKAASRHLVQAEQHESIGHYREERNPREAQMPFSRAYAHRTLGEYILDVKREQFLLQQIRELQPRVAVLGRDHAEIFQLMPHLMQSEGVTAEHIFLDTMGGKLGARKYGQKHDRISERESLLREHASVTRSRPTYVGMPGLPTERQPDYLGYACEVYTFPRGSLFEIYLNEDRKTGVAYSLKKQVAVEGQFDGPQLQFAWQDKREYAKVFIGSWQGGECSGQAQYSHQRVTEEFLLVPFAENVRLKGRKFVTR